MDGADCLGVAVTTEKIPENIQVITLLESIRIRSWMYLKFPREPLRDIFSILVDNFLHQEVTEFSICEKPNFYIIKSKQDWINHNNKGLDYYFNQELNFKGGMNAGVFLTAMYFPFYTVGDTGEYGNQELLDEYCSENTKEELGDEGRILIISKRQQLPKNHGINFERPERTLYDLENERKWLNLAIQQAKTK